MTWDRSGAMSFGMPVAQWAMDVALLTRPSTTTNTASATRSTNSSGSSRRARLAQTVARCPSREASYNSSIRRLVLGEPDSTKKRSTPR